MTNVNDGDELLTSLMVPLSLFVAQSTEPETSAENWMPAWLVAIFVPDAMFSTLPPTSPSSLIDKGPLMPWAVQS